MTTILRFDMIDYISLRSSIVDYVIHSMYIYIKEL